MKIACIGEAMVELSLATDNPTVGFAGDTLNTAVYLRRALPPEHQVDFVSVVGSDPISDRMVAFIAAQGISTASISRHPDRIPGLYASVTDTSGERSFFYWRDSSAARTLFSDGFDRLSTFDVIYLSAITLAILPTEVRENLLDWLHEWSGISAFDSNYRPKLWEDQATARHAVSRAWRICNIGLPSLDDEMSLFGDRNEQAVISRFRGYGLTNGVLKRGELGPRSLAGAVDREPVFRAVRNVVDTTAAGDSFNGAYMGALLTGSCHNDAMLAGHKCASKVIGQTGAIVPVDN